MNLQGQFLIASPQLREPTFFHTVILMVRHDSEGALGIVLNQPSNHTLGEIWGDALAQPCGENRDKRVYVGGPCQGTLLAMHETPELSEFEVIPGVFCCMQKEGLQRVIDQASDDHSRIFTGYSGWGAEQLEDELKSGSWLTTGADAHSIFSSHDDLWKALTEQVGRRVVDAAVQGRELPPDPSLN